MGDLNVVTDDVTYESLIDSGIVVWDEDSTSWYDAFLVGPSLGWFRSLEQNVISIKGGPEYVLQNVASNIDGVIVKEFASRGRRIATSADWHSINGGEFRVQMLKDMLYIQLSMGQTGRAVHIPYKQGQWKKAVKAVHEFCDWADKQDLLTLKALEASGSPAVDESGVKFAENLFLAYKHREKYEKMMGKKVDPSDVEDVAEFARVWWLMHG